MELPRRGSLCRTRGNRRTVINAGGDHRCLVQANVADALALCGPYRTIGAHTRNIIEQFPELAQHTEHTEKTLLSLAEAGLFESSEATWQRLTAKPSDTAAVAAT